MKTNITINKLRKLNKWIKTDEQAIKIIKDINNKPSISFDSLILESQSIKKPLTEAQRVKQEGRA